MRRSLLALAVFAGALVLAVDTPLHAGRIEAVQGKRYTLTKKHGPWTIMVASFQDIPEKKVVVEDGRPRVVRNPEYVPGTSAYDAADQLVFELRSYGIPAYTFEQKAEYDQATTVDRLQRTRSRTYTSKKRNIAVLAGNYKSAKDDTAQATLQHVKRFMPKFLSQPASSGDAYTTHSATGAAFRPTPGQPTPLSGAFLTVNPMLTRDEARAMSGQRDPLLLRLNSGIDHSLLKNRGRYTVLVASFWGNSAIQANAQRAGQIRGGQTKNSLDTAAASAGQMCRYLRSKGTEAYVLHERYRSIVTVGSFDSPNDPRIGNIMKFFGPKVITDPRTGAKRMKYEVLTMPRAARDGSDIHLPMDPRPHAIPVPSA